MTRSSLRAIGSMAAGLMALAVAGAAAGGVVNRAQIGVPGRNITEGYSPALYVVVASPAEYRRGCCTDSDSGEWKGPRYKGSDNTISGDSSIDWSVDVDNHRRTAAAVAREAFVHDWPVETTRQIRVPHLVNGRKVGTIIGTAALSKSPGTGSAQVEGALAFPLCRGMFAFARFGLLSPSSVPTGTGGEYTVDGTPALDWNRRQLDVSLQGVSLIGPLPVGTVTARASGGGVAGRVTDCAGHPVPGARVVARGVSAKTDLNGSYRLTGVPSSATAVSVTAGGATVTAALRK
jgi:hypothetical protein